MNNDMPTTFRALACDYDGTVAVNGTMSASTIDALKCVTESGRKVFLVTGRTVSALQELLVPPMLFDCWIAENGAVLHWPKTGATSLLCRSFPEALKAELLRMQLSPLTIGQVLISARREHDEFFQKLTARHCFQTDFIYNKSDVMLLPKGVSKKSGLTAACKLFELDLARVVGAGDAENDLELLACCGYAVAVANALPEVKAAADFVTQKESGEGIAELIVQLLPELR